MNVLVDFHHGDLLTSLYILFVQRMGWTMYVPMGIDWFNEGYWGLSDKLATVTARQYLETPTLKTSSLVTPERPELRYVRLPDIKAGTIKFDVIVASVPCNFLHFSKLNKEFGMGAKMILQTGNNWSHRTLDTFGIKNLLASSRGPYLLMTTPPNRVFYHQEFSLDMFSKKKECNIKSAVNFQHCMDRFDLFSAVESLLPDWEFKAYGTRNRDGTIFPRTKVAQITKNVGFIYHVKVVDEGYGYVIHNAFACGTPILTDTTHMTVYYDRSIPNTATALFTPETIIDVKGLTPSQIADELKRWADNYWYHSEKTYEKFREIVDFEKEFKDIKRFLDNLL